MRYYEFRYLVEGYPQAQAAFIQAGADTAAVQKTIADFKHLVTRNQVKDVNQKNIDWWAKQGWDKFNQFVNQAAAVPSKTQVVRKKLPGQSINLVDNAQWFIVIPLDKDASCFHGKNSNWCTTKVDHSYFEEYFYDSEITLIYCFNKSTGGMWAIAAHKKTDQMEMFDQKDNTLTADQFKQQTRLDPMELRNLAMGDVHQPNIQASRDKWKASIELTKGLLYRMSTGTRSPEIEKQLLYNKSSELCFEYIKNLTAVESNDFPLSIQLAAVAHRGSAILYIKNISPQTQLAAVKRNGKAIKFIENPSPQLQMAAVNQNGNAIEFIENPNEQLQMTAVKNYGVAIQHIKNPSPQIQLAAVTNAGLSIKFIENPSPQLQMAAVTNDGLAITYIKNPSEQVQLAAVENYAFAIIEIENPSEAVQLAAVKKNKRVIKLIKNPSHTVLQAAGLL